MTSVASLKEFSLPERGVAIAGALYCYVLYHQKRGAGGALPPRWGTGPLPLPRAATYNAGTAATCWLPKEKIGPAYPAARQNLIDSGFAFRQDSGLALRNYANSPVEAAAGGIIDCLQRFRGTSAEFIDKNAVFVLVALQCQRQGFATHEPHPIWARLPLVASGAVCIAGDRSG